MIAKEYPVAGFLMKVATSELHQSLLDDSTACGMKIWQVSSLARIGSLSPSFRLYRLENEARRDQSHRRPDRLDTVPSRRGAIAPILPILVNMESIGYEHTSCFIARSACVGRDVRCAGCGWL